MQRAASPAETVSLTAVARAEPGRQVVRRTRAGGGRIAGRERGRCQSRPARSRRNPGRAFQRFYCFAFRCTSKECDCQFEIDRNRARGLVRLPPLLARRIVVEICGSQEARLVPSRICPALCLRQLRCWSGPVIPYRQSASLLAQNTGLRAVEARSSQKDRRLRTAMGQREPLPT